MANSTQNASKRKPGKPYEGFPLFSHPSGQWAKKIRGKLYYFGVWADPEAALERLNREYPYLKEGRTPPPVDVSDGLTLRQLCNTFLSAKEDSLNAGELSPRSFQDYFQVCETILDQFGRDRLVIDLQAADFQKFRSKLAKRYGVVSVRNWVNRVRVVFSFAFKNGLLDKPVAYGAAFDRPSAKTLRKSRNEAGSKIFTREEVLQILDYLAGKPVVVDGETISGNADVVMTAMVLLALNCGFGNTDVATLPQSAIDWKTGFLDFPRVKTEIPRRIPLWSRTLDALREAIKVRPTARNAEDGRLCFLTAKRRYPWVRVRQKETKEGDPPAFVSIDAVQQEFKKVLVALHINGRRGLGFYTFRHCFETVAGESRDQVAVDAIMGHVDPSMGANYRHGVSDERLRAVVDVVENWLFAKE